MVKLSAVTRTEPHPNKTKPASCCYQQSAKTWEEVLCIDMALQGHKIKTYLTYSLLPEANLIFKRREKSTEVLGVMKASGVISLGIGPLLLLEFDRKSEGAGSGGIFLRSVCEPLPDSLSELWSVRWSENPAGNTK